MVSVCVCRCLSVCLCVRHIPFLASLQSRCDLQASVSVTTFYCLQACEQGLLFGRGLNSKSNKLGFFIWQRFSTAMVFFRFPDRKAEAEDGGVGWVEEKSERRVDLEIRRIKRKKAVWWCDVKKWKRGKWMDWKVGVSHSGYGLSWGRLPGNEYKSAQYPPKWQKQVAMFVCVWEKNTKIQVRFCEQAFLRLSDSSFTDCASAFPTWMALWNWNFYCICLSTESRQM